MTQECPTCGAIGDKLTAIVRQGIVATGGLDADGVEAGSPFADTYLDVHMSTGLAATLARPLEPVLQKPRLSCVRVLLTGLGAIPFVGLFVAGVIAAVMFTGHAAIGGQPGVMGVLVPVILLATGGGGLVGLIVPTIVWYRRGSKRAAAHYEQDLQAYVVAMDVYDRLRYCQRDDLVYDPTTGTTFPPNQLLAFLHQVGYGAVASSDEMASRVG